MNLRMKVMFVYVFYEIILTVPIKLFIHCKNIFVFVCILVKTIFFVVTIKSCLKVCSKNYIIQNINKYYFYF